MGRHVRAGDLDIWVEQAGGGPDVLLIAGWGDTAEAWHFQIEKLSDRYRLTAFDNRKAGRTAMPDGSVSVEAMAEEAAGVLQAFGIGSTHVAGFPRAASSARNWRYATPGSSAAWCCRAPGRCRIATFAPWAFSFARSPRWRSAERAFLEGLFLDIYTARAHNDGTVSRFIEEPLVFPHKQGTGDMQRFLDAILSHDTSGRLPRIAAPTLVLAGGRDSTSRPELCRSVADRIPGALLEVMEQEAHQPFQEVPEQWNARVHVFWHGDEGQAR